MLMVQKHCNALSNLEKVQESNQGCPEHRDFMINKQRNSQKPAFLLTSMIFIMVQFSIKADFGGQHKHCSALEPKPRHLAFNVLVSNSSFDSTRGQTLRIANFAALSPTEFYNISF